MLRSTLAACGLICAALPPATAQSFSYPNFASTAGLNLLGNSAQSGTALRLTDTVVNQTGWAWRQTAVPVVNGFDTTFTFRITPPAVGQKAEGMALVIHDDANGANAMGGTVWGMGYGAGANSSPGIRNSIAVEYDTYQDGFLNDTSANELTIHTRGSQGNNENEQYSIGRNTPAVNLSNAQVHTLRVVYVPGQIEVFVDNAPTPAISRSYDLVAGGTYLSGGAAPGANMVNGTAFVGFCATTGANNLTERVEILSWDWTSTPLTHPCYAGSIAADVLTIDGSSGDLFREVHIATYQPFAIELADPPAFGAGAPYVLFASLLPQPGAFGSQLGFGETCFPVLPAGPAELVLADSFGLFPALLPAGPTPVTFALPVGLITFPLDLTLQAVMLSSASPLGFGVSNAIDLSIAPAGPPSITTVSPLSASAGQPITISGNGFVPGLSLSVNGAPVTPTSISPTTIGLAYPAGIPCGSQVTVMNPDGQSAVSAINPQPVVTGTFLGSGPAAGNAIFIVQGTGFAVGTTVTVGGAPAVVVSAGALAVTVRTPPGMPGVAPVVLTTPGGCTVSTTYTYQ
jgi:hypothetical protein